MNSIRFVAIADIADFYPRIYQHRLENVIQTVATSPRGEEVARVLVKKFLFNIAGGISYGIPVGPYASRVLAEGLLIDVDDALEAHGINFVRWVDDFSFFCRTDAEAQYFIFFLSRWLFDQHGLTLQSAKTRIVSDTTFVTEYLETHETKLEDRVGILKDLWGRISPYEEDEEPLSEEEVAELERTNFKELLEEAFVDIENIDYEMAKFILGRLPTVPEFRDEWRATIVDILLENIDHLYPISDSVARFFKSFDDIDPPKKRIMANALLRPIVTGAIPPPDYYTMWVLSIFIEDKSWNNASKLAKIFTDARGETVKRYAALALEKNGTRAQALIVRSHYDHASPLLKLAILRTTRLLGTDERKFWKRGKRISGLLEKRV